MVNGAKFVKTVTKSASPLDAIISHLSGALALTDQHIHQVVVSDTRLVEEVGRYVLDNSGKKLRPILLLLAAQAAGYKGDKHTHTAAALEIIHTATLLHDDVIDQSALRRGKPSVNAKYGQDVAILIADFLYANAFRLAMASLSPQVIGMICQVTARMCEGEMFQIEKRNEWMVEDDYLRIVRSKTAYLFSACAGLGGVLSGIDDEKVESLSRFGLNFGTAFQITDDVLDLAGHDSALGKEAGTDIRNGKQTLPLIYAFHRASVDGQQKLREAWENGRDSDVFRDAIHNYGGIEYAIKQARQYSDQARECLNVLPPSIEKDFLDQIATYVVDRTY